MAQQQRCLLGSPSDGVPLSWQDIAFGLRANSHEKDSSFRLIALTLFFAITISAFIKHLTMVRHLEKGHHCIVNIPLNLFMVRHGH